MRAERNIRALLLITFLGLLPPLALAKGPFQAMGKVTDVRREGDVITFRFSGTIAFGFWSKPARDAARAWKDAHFDVTNLQVQVKDWTEPYKPGERPSSDNVAHVYQKLADLASPGRNAQLSIDNPGLTFSNTGELVRVSGTFAYVAPTG